MVPARGLLGPTVHRRHFFGFSGKTPSSKNSVGNPRLWPVICSIALPAVRKHRSRRSELEGHADERSNEGSAGDRGRPWDDAAVRRHLGTASNWSGGVAPTFDSTASLLFSGLTENTTIFGGFGTTVMNRMTVSTNTNLRFNSVGSTFNFAGDSPTVDTQAGAVRLEVIITNTAGLTKTGSGTLFSNACCSFSTSGMPPSR